MYTHENTVNANQWLVYYEEFTYFSPEKVRKGCHPRKMEHEESHKAIVLVHGLTDSPYFMTAIGEHFFALGYNVYLPLLHYHGLKAPEGMEGVDLKEWKKNVHFAINTAALKAERISIGGLSTGGTLSFYMACTNSKINGDLYLFSAALDLNVGPKGILGNIIEKLLRIKIIANILDKKDEKKPLVKRNPYKYDRMDIDGAQKLSMLIKETDDLLGKFNRKNPFPKRVFAAHSECDKRAHIKEICKLQKKTPSDRFKFHIIPKKEKVSHASVVLKNPIYAMDNNKMLEKEYEDFDKMMKAITEFEKDSS